MDQPNIILLFCDQMRGDALGCDGNDAISTPNLDALAAGGTRFNHAYSAVPSCLPARAILWTGMDQWHTGVLGMGKGQGPIPNDFPHTLAGELTRAGYTTQMVGKGHFEPHRALMGFENTKIDESGRTLKSGFKDDYREWFDKNTPDYLTPDDHGVDWNSWVSRPWHTEEHLHPTSWTMTASIEFLKSRPKDKPFFLNISFARPHSPYDPPEHYFNRYIDSDLPEPSLGEWSPWHDDPETAKNVNAWRGKMKPADIKRARAGYYGSISFIDAQIGRLMNWMSRFDNEALRSTWFVFSSDHGDMQGDHNLWRKTYAYEGSSRIPFIIKPPGGSSRKKAAEVVELRDIMPTLLEAAGVDIPSTVQGKSLIPLLNEKPEKWRGYIHGEHCWCYSPEQEMQFVTNGKKKYIWFPRIDREQFFDLENDPGECNDLIQDPHHKEEIELWRGFLIAELEKRDCGWVVDGKLHCPEDTLVSPWKDQRWDGES